MQESTIRALKSALQERIQTAWQKYLTFADPSLRSQFAQEYCALKEQYTLLFGEDARS